MPEKKLKSAANVEGLQKTLDALVAQLAAINARLDKLEAAAPAAATPAPAVEAAPVAQPPAVQPAVAAPTQPADEFNEELLLVLTAAVAAYLGKRPHIRAIRLLGSGAWAQQGRVFVQASHQLNVPHDA